MQEILPSFDGHKRMRTDREIRSPSPLPKKGSVVELVIDSLAHGNGLGVSRLPSPHESFVIMVQKAIPGERIKARIISRKRQYAEAMVVERLGQPSPYATEPRCRHFLEGCGGCKFQNLIYSRQLLEKDEQVKILFRNMFRRMMSVAGDSDDDVAMAAFEWLPVVGASDSSQEYEYRNKMEFTFGTRKWYPRLENNAGAECKSGEPPDVEEPFALGLHAPRQYDKVLCVEDCALQCNVSNDILRFVELKTRPLASSQLPPYDNRTHTGYLRNLMIRSAVNAKGEREIMVNFVTSPPQEVFQEDALRELATKIWETFGVTGRGVVCVVNNVTSTKSGVTTGESEHLLAGHRDHIEHAIHPLRWLDATRVKAIPANANDHAVCFRISANSFFQTNPVQADKLIARIIEATDMINDFVPLGAKEKDSTRSERRKPYVVDLFCGTGAITLCLAPYARRVLGVELSESAVRDAKFNAEQNGIQNAVFRVANLELSDMWSLIAEAAEHTNESRTEDGEKRENDDRVDVLVMDPPRAGVHPRQIKAIIRAPAALRPHRIVYVSCNPTTQTRDIEMILTDAPWYRLESVANVDQFPHTPHVETIATLVLGS